MAQRGTRRKRVLGSNVVYRTDSMMAVLVAAGLRRWDNRWLCLPWLQRAACVVVAGVFLSQAQDGFSNPVGGNVVVGKATVTSSGGTVQIDQTTKIVIIDWSKFNIAKGETTQFLQPGTNALAVNRIGGNDPSQILGSLLANGRIILINGNGILFGPNAKVDVGALIATTSDASNSDIASGKATFDKAGNPNAMVVNQGSINAKTGMVGLVAPAVRNDGVIMARLSNVTLGASNIFTIDFTGDGLISFPLDANVVSKAIDANGKPVEALVVNNGRIEGATVLLTARAAKDLVRNVVSMGGIITANKVTQQGGNVVLGTDDEATNPKVTLDGNGGGVSVTGSMTAPGGAIVVTGNAVTFAGATLTTSNATAGGSVRIGGNDTAAVTVDQASLLAASAVSFGDGGNIYVMSNDTRFAGRAEAKGGAAGGNGGNIETSGHVLDIAGASIDTSAVSGRAGNWLLDPDDYTIDATQASTIQTNLANGNVTIQTTLAGSGGNGDIFVNAPVSWSNGNSLTLSAYRNIQIADEAVVANTGAGNLVLRADNTGTGDGTVFLLGNSKLDWSASTGTIALYYNPTGTTFTDDFNRVDGVVGNGWSLVADSVGMAPGLVDGRLTTVGAREGSGRVELFRSVDMSNGVSVSADLTYENGFGGLRYRYTTEFLLGGDGSFPSGLALDIGRGDENYSDSKVTLFYNGTEIGRALSPFQYGAQLHVAFDRSSYGVISGVVMGDGNTFNFRFDTSSIVLGGTAVAVSLTGADTRSAVLTFPTVDNIVITTGTGPKYVTPTDFSSHIRTSTTGQLSAYMLVNNVTDLQNIQNNLSGTYALGRDIDASATATWNGGAGFEPIGTDGSRNGFTGTFTGLGNTISNLTINRTSSTNVGLFGYVGYGGTISDVGLLRVSVSGGDVVGGLVGELSRGTIERSYASGTVSGGDNVGGLVGQSGYSDGQIAQSHALGTVSGNNQVGGLVGQNVGIVTQSYASATVSGTTSVGGLVGSNSPFGSINGSFATGIVMGGDGVGGLVGALSGIVIDSYATGNVSGVGAVGGLAGGFGHMRGFPSSVLRSHANGNVTGNQYVGGLVGYVGQSTVVNQSYATGDVVGEEYVGGLAGVVDLDARVYRSYATGDVFGVSTVGGLIGHLESAVIGQTFSTGNVIGTGSGVGGLVGTAHDAGIEQSFWDTDSSGQANGVGAGDIVAVAGLTSAQARTQSSYVGWDFAGTWFMIDGETRPFLRSEYSTTITNAHQLQLMAMNLSASYTLANDIDLGPALAADTNGNYSGMWGASGFVPLGTTSSPFSGLVDGAGHVVENLVINRWSSSDVGLFGVVAWNGTVQNVGLIDGSVSGYGDVGSIVGLNNGLVNNSFVRGSVSGNYNVGGVVGSNNGTIEQSHASGTTYGSGGGVGGLVGQNRGEVTQSYSTADVEGGWSAGGLVGVNGGGAITQSYSSGAVGAVGVAGGLVGDNSGTIQLSYTIGSVKSDDVAGGLVGSNEGSVYQTYASGAVSGGNSAGGLAGYNTGVISASYWDMDTTGQVSGGVGVDSGDERGQWGLSTSQAREQNWYSEWNFSSDWIILGYGDGSTRPFLRSEESPTVSNSHQLQLIGASNQFATYTLTSDIDLGPALTADASGNYPSMWGPAGFVPICPYIAFCFLDKTFDGEGHTISGLKINRPTADYVGLFGVLAFSTIKNVAVYGDVTGKQSVGILAGININGDISNSYVVGTVRGETDVGGMVGYNLLYNTDGISRSYANVNVYGVDDVGGLVGGSRQGNNSSGGIIQSFAAGSVYGTGSNVGGLIGSNGLTIKKSFAWGRVTGTSAVGGLVGSNQGVVDQSYATGAVNGAALAGGLAGVNSGTFTHSYWDSQTTGQLYGAGGGSVAGMSGLQSANFQNQKLPSGFDPKVWGTGWWVTKYPCLLGLGPFGCSAAQPWIIDLTYSIADSSPTYGTLATLGAVTLTGVLEGDVANVAPVLGLFDTSNSAVSLVDTLNAGTYAVKVTSLTGSAAPNYTIAPTGNHDGTLTINPAPLIVAVNNASRIYGDANPAFTANITGFVLGQNASVLSDLYLLTSADETSNVGTYGITAAGVSGNYYIASATDGTLTVTQRPITVAANNVSRIYGDANPNLTYSVTMGMLVNDDTLNGALATSAGLTSNIGGYTITQGTVAASSNYAVTFQSGTLNVQQRPISVAADTLSRSYGDANPNMTYAVTSGNLVNGDSLSGALATSAVVTSGIGNYAVEQGTLAATSNYALSFQPGTLTIAPRPVSVTADSTSRLYGDSNPPLTYSVTSGNLINGDAFGGYLTTTAGVSSNVGGYAIGQGTLGLSSNYALSFAPGTLTINPAPVTIAMDNVSRAYGDANPALTATITGLKLGQDASVLSGLTYATTATQASNIGGYAITSSGGTAENYYIAGRTDGTLTVIARAITVTADTLSRAYGGQNPTLTYAVTSGNLVNGDLLSGALTTTATALSNVGSYVIGQGTLAASSNYALTFQPGALVITPRMITVAADNLSRLYGDPNGALTYTITSGNLVNGDALTGALATTAVQASDVGSYVISQGTLVAPLNNYALSFTPGTLTINPAQLSVAVNDAARLYGDANPQFSAVITGFKLGQDSSVLSGLTFSTTATQTSSVGGYTVSSSGGTAVNYTITSRTNGTLTVTARPITVAANNLSRVYGGANPALTYSLTSGGLVNGDRLIGALATSAVAASNVGGYAITQGSLAASSNYVLSFAPGTLTVFARPITVIANNATRIYGDANPALTYVISSGNLVNGDTLAGVLSTSAVLTSNVGNYSIARGSLTAGSNYNLNFQPGTLSITPRAITVAADNKSRTYGDANPGLTYAVTSGSLVNGDGITGALSTSAVLTSAVANYAINQGTLTAGSNYTLSFQSGTLAVTQRAITVTANNMSRSYGDTNPNLTYSITTGTLVNGDTLAGSLATSAVQTSAVGIYAIGQGSLAASSNYTVAFQGGTLAITPAALTVTVNNASRMYGYANPDFTATITGFKNGEDASVVSGLVLLTDAVRTSSTGTYAIKSSGGTATNYVIVTRTDGTLTVEPLPAATMEQMNGVGTYLGNLPVNQSDQNLPLCTNTEVIAVANDNGVSQVVLGAPQCR